MSEQHFMDPEVRRYVAEHRLMPRHMWHHLRPGDVARLDETRSRSLWLVISRVHLTETVTPFARKEWSRLVILGPGPTLWTVDV